MKFLEKDLEEVIFTSNRNHLSDRGLYDYGKFLRQVRIGNYGIADLISITRPYNDGSRHVPGVIRVYELKKDKISPSTFLQCLGYARGVQRYIERNKPDQYGNWSIEICLIGKTVDSNSTFVYLTDLFASYDEYSIHTTVKLYTYDFRIDGMYFEEVEGYHLIKEGF